MPFFEKNKLLLIHIPKTGGTSIEKYFSKKFNIRLGPNELYFSYYENTIANELTKCRKIWKDILQKKKKLQNNLTIKRVSSFTSIDSLDNNNNRETIPEFKLFKKIRLASELRHSLQHLTWCEMQRNKEILWDNTEHRIITSNDPYDRNEYEILTVVRNPYDRIVSEMLFRGIINNETICRRKTLYNKLKKFLEKQEDIFDNHKLPQYLYLINDIGQILENVTILHTETLTEDMQRIGYCDFDHYYQVSKCKVKTGITKYSSYLNGHAIELINTYYKRDFELFNYDML